MGQIGCLETSVKNYDSTLHNNPEARDSQKEDNVSCMSNKVLLDTLPMKQNWTFPN